MGESLSSDVVQLCMSFLVPAEAARKALVCKDWCRGIGTLQLSEAGAVVCRYARENEWLWREFVLCQLKVRQGSTCAHASDRRKIPVHPGFSWFLPLCLLLTSVLCLLFIPSSFPLTPIHESTSFVVYPLGTRWSGRERGWRNGCACFRLLVLLSPPCSPLPLHLSSIAAAAAAALQILPRTFTFPAHRPPHNGRARARATVEL